MNVNRLLRNLFQPKKAPPRRFHPNRPWWDRLPPLQLPRLGFRFPRVSNPQFTLPSIPNPLASIPFNLIDRQRFWVIANWLGYILLFVSTIDYILILYPPQLTNPAWELQAFTRMVDNAWFLMLALILVFIPTRNSIRRYELNFLSLLRWSMLVGGAVFILLIPLGVINTQRINQNVTVQIGRQESVRQEQLDNLQNAIETQNIAPRQGRQLAEALGVEVSPSDPSFKEALIQRIQEQKQELRQRVAIAKGDRFRQLLRQAVRTHIGALLIGSFLVRLWWESRWVKEVKDQASNMAK